METAKKYLICIDSDGCAMDTMNCKHIHCFGPSLVEIWGLEAYRQEILEKWNEINLFSATRGINRFKGLVLMLAIIQETMVPIAGLEKLKEWVESTKELSNPSLKAYLETAGEVEDTECLKKAYQWSLLVNERIEELPESEKVPFPGAKEALAFLHERARIAIVSSANYDAVEKEWKENGLLPYVDGIMAQNKGSKQECIEKLLAEGYDKDNTLMIGDAPGDMEAARQNGVSFYPIFPGKERESWEELRQNGAGSFFEGGAGKAYLQDRIEKYCKYLGL